MKRVKGARALADKSFEVTGGVNKKDVFTALGKAGVAAKAGK